MIAMGGRPWQTASQRTQWVELKHADAALVHPVKKRLRHRERTETIVDDVDLDDATLLRDQGLGELASDRIAGELIGLEVDVVVSGLDRVEHRTIRGGPVFEQCDFVAYDQRTSRNHLLENQVTRENVGRAGGLFQFSKNLFSTPIRDRPVGTLEFDLLLKCPARAKKLSLYAD